MADDVRSSSASSKEEKSRPEGVVKPELGKGEAGARPGARDPALAAAHDTGAAEEDAGIPQIPLPIDAEPTFGREGVVEAPISIDFELGISTVPPGLEFVSSAPPSRPVREAGAPAPDASAQLLPQLSSELSPSRSERPPPPSQRGGYRTTLRVGAAAAPARGAAAEPEVASPSVASEPAPGGRRSWSEPVPLVTHKASKAPPGTGPGRTSTMPPGLVEPKRIIEVLGSNVPVLDSAWEEEAIEDLDASEAHELLETPVPESVRAESEPELELPLVIDDGSEESAPAPEERSSPRATGGQPLRADKPEPEPRTPPFPSAVGHPPPSSTHVEPAPSPPQRPPANGVAPSAVVSLVPEPPSEDGRAGEARPKVPPNRKRRPPPPSTRLSERAKPEPPAAGRKWWEELFSEEFLRAIPILTPRQLEREVSFIDEGLGVAPGGRILDLACGAGQHAVELAARGYDVVGFDLSQSQLDWAGGLALERGQRLQFTCADMRELSYVEDFDAVFCWNTSFGFFEEEKNVDIAQRVFKALRPGGRFLLDVVNRDYVVAQQPGQTWFEGDGCVCIDDVSIDFITSRMKVKRTLMLTTGKNRECNYSLRIYALHELGKMLHDVGFKVLNVSGRPEMPGVFFGSTSPRIIILAAKP